MTRKTFEKMIISTLLSGGCFYESQWTRLRLYIDGNDCGYRSFKIESSMGQIESLLKVTNDPVDFMCQVCKELYQVWSLTLFYSVDFSKSRIDVKKCVFNKRTIKVCVSCC